MCIRDRRAAAKRNPNCLWAVANNTNLPFARGTIDIITSLFGFPTWQAWTQLQIVGQRVLVVDAGVDHLIELREKLYKTVRKHAAPTHEKAVAAGYQIIREQACQYTGQLTSAQLLLPLAQMTPHAYRSDRERLDQLAQLGTKDKASTTSMTIDLVIREYEKTNDT